MNACPPWCTRSHTAPVPVLTHDRVIAEHRTDSGDSITVRIVWREHPGAGESAPVRVVLDTTTPGYTSVLELSREDADILSDTLTLARGPRWLCMALARGAGFAEGWEMPPAPPACPPWCEIRDCRGAHIGTVTEWESGQRITEVAVRQMSTDHRPQVVIFTETWNDLGDTTSDKVAAMPPVVALATGLMLRRGRLSAALLSAAACAGVAGQQEAVHR